MPGDITLERLLPFSAESERAVLGAILLDDKAFSAAAELLSAEDFYDERNRRIYRAMLSLVGDERPIRMILLLEELRRSAVIRKRKREGPPTWPPLPTACRKAPTSGTTPRPSGKCPA